MKLLTEASSLLSVNDKELGRIVLRPTCTGVHHAPDTEGAGAALTPSLAGQPFKQTDWYKMQTSKHCVDDLRIKITVRMEKPTNLKYCGCVTNRCILL